MKKERHTDRKKEEKKTKENKKDNTPSQMSSYRIPPHSMFNFVLDFMQTPLFLR
jgi:hypothetical protein